MSESRESSEGAFGATRNWSREQTLLAFQFYCETPFGQLHKGNKQIIELAGLIGRTPDALAMKCSNFASLDPAIRGSGRSGLKNASVLDRKVWDEFHTNWNDLVEECDALRNQLLAKSGYPELLEEELPYIEPDFTGEVRVALGKYRVKQGFFRRSILGSYGGKCCISGVRDESFLVASHIVPWHEDPSIRLHPGNGLCLSAIHDKAFDNHLFSLSDDFRVVLSTRLKATSDQFLRDVFWPVEDQQISLPEKFAPDPQFIARHRAHMNGGIASEIPR